MEYRPRHRALARYTSVPASLTETLIQGIQALPDGRKYRYLKEQFLSKFVSNDTDPASVRRTRAISKWLATERENEATNHRILLTHGEYNILPRVSYDRFVSFCRDLIVQIIGDTVPEHALIGAFSGGASTSRKRTESNPAFKYLGKAHATSRCIEWLDTLREEMPIWLDGGHDISYDIVAGNVLFTVPKNAEIDRCACKEPDVNMFMQKGFGNEISRCLRRIGINLNDQGRNRSLARIGSINGSLATLDLSSASDSVSIELVAEMLPVCWYTALDSVRSQVTVVDGEEHRNEMFSSMGNGFTFELESLLFYTIARAVSYFRGVSGIVSVYGDDIIVPSECYHDLVWVLGYFGFQVNDKKSFYEGAFRESCGGHYDDGVDITPFFLDEVMSNYQDVILVANQLRAWSDRNNLGICDPLIEDLWLLLKGCVPRGLWGGEDLQSKSQLVSYDLPHSRLREKSRRRSTGTGGYLHWLNTTWDRDRLTDGVRTSSYTSTSSDVRVVPVRLKVMPRLSSLFLSELG